MCCAPLVVNRLVLHLDLQDFAGQTNHLRLASWLAAFAVIPPRDRFFVGDWRCSILRRVSLEANPESALELEQLGALLPGEQRRSDAVFAGAPGAADAMD